MQIELVEDQTGNMDPRTNFKLIVIQTELERFKFLVRSFLRARLNKVRLLRSIAEVDACVDQAFVDRPTPPSCSRSAHGFPRLHASPPLAVRTAVPHITSGAPLATLFCLLSIAISSVVTTARRHNGWH